MTTKSTKMLFVFPLAQFWGGEVILSKILGRLDRNRYEITCLVFGKGELVDRLREAGLHFLTLPKVRLRQCIAFFALLRRAVSLLKKERYEIIHTLGVDFLTTLAAVFLKMPLVVHYHTIHPLTPIDVWCLKRTWHIVTVSQYAKGFLEKYGIAEKRVDVVYNGIDLVDLEQKTSKTDIRKELAVEDANLVCYVGRIVPYKNLAFLINVIPCVVRKVSRRVVFLFVGDTPKLKKRQGDYKDVLGRFVQKFGIADNVIFLGRRQDIFDILNSSDVFVMPSLFEVCSMSILEAMACGKPVVAMHAGGNEEIIQEDTGLLVEPGDIEGFSQAIVFLLEDKEKAARLGEAAKNRARQFFTIEQSVAAFVRILEKICSMYVTG